MHNIDICIGRYVYFVDMHICRYVYIYTYTLKRVSRREGEEEGGGCKGNLGCQLE